MFYRAYVEAMMGLVKYYKVLATVPKKVFPQQAMKANKLIKFNEKVFIRYRLHYRNCFFNGYMQLWYKYFGLVYPVNLMR